MRIPKRRLETSARTMRNTPSNRKQPALQNRKLRRRNVPLSKAPSTIAKVVPRREGQSKVSKATEAQVTNAKRLILELKHDVGIIDAIQSKVGPNKDMDVENAPPNPMA